MAKSTSRTLSVGEMRGYLGRSISSLNANKLNGMLAEIDFRKHLITLGYGQQVSPGGWIARRIGENEFGRNTVVMFPESVVVGKDYGPGRSPPAPDSGLHTICSTFHQTGISAFYCSPTLPSDGEPLSMTWRSVQLGVPSSQPWQDFPSSLSNHFVPRERAYNFLRYHADTSSVPATVVGEEFAKEHLRVTFQTQYMAEVSDVDGILWGQQLTYPLEIKEKTVGYDRKMGNYFGLDVGPFVKLAFYAAKRGNLHSLFVVREIADVQTRELVQWWYITFEHLARFASWNKIGGGTNMLGGASTVIQIPRAEFLPLDAARIAQL
jgi:hypothetical protein